MKLTRKILVALLTLALLVGLVFAIVPMAADNNEAKIGTTEYATLQEALDAVSDGDTVTLLRNVTLRGTTAKNSTSFTGVQFTFDLNGYVLTLDNYTLLFKADAEGKGSDATFVDNGAVKGKIVTTGSGAYLQGDQSTLTFNGVTIEGPHYGASVKMLNGTADHKSVLKFENSRFLSNYATFELGNIFEATFTNSEVRSANPQAAGIRNAKNAFEFRNDAAGEVVFDHSVFEFYWRGFVSNLAAPNAELKVTMKDSDIIFDGSTTDGALSRAVNMSFENVRFLMNAKMTDANRQDSNINSYLDGFTLGAFDAVMTFVNEPQVLLSDPINMKALDASNGLVAKDHVAVDAKLWYREDASGYNWMLGTDEQMKAWNLTDAVASPMINRSFSDMETVRNYNDANAVQGEFTATSKTYGGVLLQLGNKWGQAGHVEYIDANGNKNSYVRFYAPKSGKLTATAGSPLDKGDGKSFYGADAYFEIAMGSGAGATKYPADEFGYYTFDFDLFTESEFITQFRIAPQTRHGENGKSVAPGGTADVVVVTNNGDGTVTFAAATNGAKGKKTFTIDAYERLHITLVVNPVIAATSDDAGCQFFDTAKSTYMFYINGEALNTEPLLFAAGTVNILDGVRLANLSGVTVKEGQNFCLDNVKSTAYYRVENDWTKTLASLFADPAMKLTDVEYYGYSADYKFDTAPAIATVDGKSYGSFAEAVAAAAASDSKTLELVRDVKNATPVKDEIIVNSNGHAYVSHADSLGYIEKDGVYTYSKNLDVGTLIFADIESSEIFATIPNFRIGSKIEYPSYGDGKVSLTELVQKDDGTYVLKKLVGWLWLDQYTDDPDAYTPFLTKVSTVEDAENFRDTAAEEASLDDFLDVSAAVLVPVFEEVTPSYLVFQEDAKTVGKFTAVEGYIETDTATYPVFKTAMQSLLNGQYLKLNIDVIYDSDYAPNIQLTNSTGDKKNTRQWFGLDLAGHTIAMDVKGSFLTVQAQRGMNVFSSEPGALFTARSMESAPTNYNLSSATFYAQHHGKLYFGNFMGSLLNPDKGTKQFGDNITFRVGVLAELNSPWSTGLGATLDGGIYDSCVTDSWGLLMARNAVHPDAPTDPKRGIANFEVKNAKIYVTAQGARNLFGFPGTNSFAKITMRDCELYYTREGTPLFNALQSGVTATLANVVGNYSLTTSLASGASRSQITLGAGNVFASIDNPTEYTYAADVILAKYGAGDPVTYTHLNAYSGTRADGYDKIMTTETFTGFNFKTVNKADAVTVTVTGLDGKTTTVLYAKGGNVSETLKTLTFNDGLFLRTFTKWNETEPTDIQENLTLTPAYTLTADMQGMKQNLSLYSKFAVNLYVPKNDAVVSVNGTAVAELETVTIDGVEYFVVTMEQNASAAGTALSFTVTLTDGEQNYDQTVALSSVKYAEKLLAQTTVTTEDKTFLAYMLNYVKAAYTYFGQTLPTEVDTMLTTLKDQMTRTLGEETKVNTMDTAIFAGASLNLASNPEFIFTFASDFEGTVKFTYTNYKGETITVEKTVKAGEKTVALDSMRAYDFDATVTVEVKAADAEAFTAAGTYNLAAYEASENVEATNALVEALKLYIQTAREYKAVMDARA